MEAASEASRRIAQAYERLRRQPTDGNVWAGLADHYRARSLVWQSRYAALQAVRCGVPYPLPQSEAAGGEDAALGRATGLPVDDMVRSFQLEAESCPSDWLTWLYLARLHDLAGRPDECASSLAQAMSLEPIAGESAHWMGVWQFNAGDGKAAVSSLASLVHQRPVRHGSMLYLGLALMQTGNEPAAKLAFTRAGTSRNPHLLRMLRQRLFENNFWQQAADLAAALAEEFPANIADWHAAAEVQIDSSLLSQARLSLDRAEVAEPGHPATAALEARYLARLGDMDASLAALQKQYRGNKDPNSRMASSIAMAALYSDRLTAVDKARLHCDLMRPIEAGFSRQREFANDRGISRRLRIGYLSGDLHRQHPVCLLMLPILQRHDKDQVEIFIYHTGRMRDGSTQLAFQCADNWTEAAGWTDRQLRDQIVADRIDILVDLAGQTSSHRLGVFATGAAPLQVSFLGYPHSTGMRCMDWLVADRHVAPVEHAALFTEDVARLPDCVFCWAPTEEFALPMSPLPRRPFTFGSFNNLMKVSEGTMALWARTLRAVPDSRLLIKAPTLHDLSVRARLTNRLEAHGLDPSRIELRGPSGLADMMAEYGDIDVALDPLPYNGGATSLQALWMGVPLVTWQGDNFTSRMGASFLAALDRRQWIAHDEDSFVTIAATLAAHRSSLATGRSAMREAMRQSPLGDIARYTKNLESLYRNMWAQCCNVAQGGLNAQPQMAKPEAPSCPPLPSHRKKKTA